MNEIDEAVERLGRPDLPEIRLKLAQLRDLRERQETLTKELRALVDAHVRKLADTIASMDSEHVLQMERRSGTLAIICEGSMLTIRPDFGSSVWQVEGRQALTFDKKHGPQAVDQIERTARATVAFFYGRR